jgi:hypothetical protein
MYHGFLLYRGTVARGVVLLVIIRHYYVPRPLIYRGTVVAPWHESGITQVLLLLCALHATCVHAVVLISKHLGVVLVAKPLLFLLWGYPYGSPSRNLCDTIQVVGIFLRLVFAQLVGSGPGESRVCCVVHVCVRLLTRPADSQPC